MIRTLLVGIGLFAMTLIGCGRSERPLTGNCASTDPAALLPHLEGAETIRLRDLGDGTFNWLETTVASASADGTGAAAYRSEAQTNELEILCSSPAHGTADTVPALITFPDSMAITGDELRYRLRTYEITIGHSSTHANFHAVPASRPNLRNLGDGHFAGGIEPSFTYRLPGNVIVLFGQSREGGRETTIQTRLQFTPRAPAPSASDDPTVTAPPAPREPAPHRPRATATAQGPSLATLPAGRYEFVRLRYDLEAQISGEQTRFSAQQVGDADPTPLQAPTIGRLRIDLELPVIHALDVRSDGTVTYQNAILSFSSSGRGDYSFRTRRQREDVLITNPRALRPGRDQMLRGITAGETPGTYVLDFARSQSGLSGSARVQIRLVSAR